MMKTVTLCAIALGLVAVQGQNLPSDYNEASFGVDACGNVTSGLCCCATANKGNGLPCTDTEKLLCEVQKVTAESETTCTGDADAFSGNANQIWILMAGFLVFFMQCGFAMLEAGTVRKKNTQNIIFKNILDICIGALSFFAVGYGFAYGDGGDNSDTSNFIGRNNFFLMKENNDETGQHMWFFQFAFAATAATIVSGSVAERTQLVAYFIYSCVITMFIYPVVVHWVWSGKGWLSAFATTADRVNPNGMIDYAGSGVVHAVGGWAGLCGAWIVGPRKGRFEELDENGEVIQPEAEKDEEPQPKEDGEEEEEKAEEKANMRCHFINSWGVKYGKPLPMAGQSGSISSLGVFILWFGWYGFNCGSTLAWDGENAGKVAVTTTLAAGAAGAIATIISRVKEGHWIVEAGLNGILAGLVSITAGCSVVDEWAALLIGAIGGTLFYFSAELLLCLKIDDPLNAWPVHGACGVWGVIAAGIFATERNFKRAYGTGYDFSAVADGRQLGTQLLGIAAILGWTVGLSLILFFLIDITVGMRVRPEVEEMGCDAHHHQAMEGELIGDLFEEFPKPQWQGASFQASFQASIQAKSFQANPHKPKPSSPVPPTDPGSNAPYGDQ
eukprot:Hpha_TRINITY_DN16654_c0_g4::TRINITY_DN16654_c0_g4_i1::g.183213::m.183213/K03320/amt, AMT, MEP; ammonium transporter, Amt family